MKSKQAECSISGCDGGKGNKLAKGFCPKHYVRFRKYGDPHKVHPSARNLKYIGCSVPGCENKHEGKGFCSKHLRRWKLYGDPNIVNSLRDGVRWDEYASLLRELRETTNQHLGVYCRQQRGESGLQAELQRTLQELEAAYRRVWLWPMD